jgi:hypothetical protein
MKHFPLADCRLPRHRLARELISGNVRPLDGVFAGRLLAPDCACVETMQRGRSSGRCCRASSHRSPTGVDRASCVGCVSSSVSGRRARGLDAAVLLRRGLEARCRRRRSGRPSWARSRLGRSLAPRALERQEPRLVGDHEERVRDAARHERHRTCSQVALLSVDVDDDLAVEDVGGLVGVGVRQGVVLPCDMASSNRKNDPSVSSVMSFQVWRPPPGRPACRLRCRSDDRDGRAMVCSWRGISVPR